MKVLLAALLLATTQGSTPTPVVVQEVLHSSDRAVSVWNWSGGDGGTMPDWVQTVRWKDDGTIRDQRFDSELGRLGWIEAIGVFETPRGPVYVLAGEDKWSTREHSLLLTAWRIRRGATELEEAVGFFPSIPGVGERNASIRWEYRRTRGRNVFPRPIEVRVGDVIRVWTPKGAFQLAPENGVLHAIDLDPGELEFRTE